MWDKDQIKQFVKMAKNRVGSGWELLGPELQKALIAEEALSVVRSQMRETVSVQAIEQLYNDMLETAKVPH
jgi:hypothetical protein